MIKRKEMSTNFEIDKLKRAHTDLTQQHRISSEQLLLARDAPSEFVGSGMAPRPSAALMRQHELNRVEAPCLYEREDQVRRELENEVNQPQSEAGQRSSIARSQLPILTMLMRSQMMSIQLMGLSFPYTLSTQVIIHF